MDLPFALRGLQVVLLFDDPRYLGNLWTFVYNFRMNIKLFFVFFFPNAARGEVWQEIKKLCLVWGLKTTQLVNNLLDMNSKSEGYEVSCSSPKLCFTSASRRWLATFPPTITVMFLLETETLIHVYAWPLWFVCCGSVVINVIYSTVENPRRLTDQKPEEKHVGGHWQFV